MFPTKTTAEYLKEMNRLFPSISENGAMSGTYNNVTVSPLNQSATVNRSTSSTDSMSPESYIDMDSWHLDWNRYDRFMPTSPRVDYGRMDTPSRRQRPIVGRKLWHNPESNPNCDLEAASKYPIFDTSQRMDSMQNTSPNAGLYDRKPYTNLYELFPSENKGFELKTPVTTTPVMTPSTNLPIHSAMPNRSPNMPNRSPNMPNHSPNMPNCSPNRPTYPPLTSSPLPNKFFSVPLNYNLNFASQFNQSFGSNSEGECQHLGRQKLCTFCRKNGETPIVYLTHCVKERMGNKQVVTCPILRSHVCSACGASGDNAHTITYCPVLRSNNNGQPLPSTTITLKNTRLKSNGRRRY